MTRPRDKGTEAETGVTRWLITHGFPDADRLALRGRLDAGDVAADHRRVTFQVKAGDAAQNPSDRVVATWLDKTEGQRMNSGAEVGVLVLRRRGHASPGQWWAVVRGDVLAWLLLGLTPGGFSAPVRLRLDAMVTALRRAGYGTPLE